MTFGPFSLEGKTALVTGASRGLGEAAALALAQAGANVAVTSRTKKSLSSICEQIEKTGRKAFPVQLDVSDIKQISMVTEEIAQALGGIDVLVNNAGTNIPAFALEITPEMWDQVLEPNLKGAFFVAQAVGKQMLKQGKGSIVNVASQMAFVGYYQRTAYCSSKGGLVQMTRALAIEWAKMGVRVNAIAPTFIESPLLEKVFQENPEMREDALGRIPMGKPGQPDDVAWGIVYLASEAARMVTGHTLIIDGGYTAW